MQSQTFVPAVLHFTACFLKTREYTDRDCGCFHSGYQIRKIPAERQRAWPLPVLLCSLNGDTGASGQPVCVCPMWAYATRCFCSLHDEDGAEVHGKVSLCSDNVTVSHMINNQELLQVQRKAFLSHQSLTGVSAANQWDQLFHGNIDLLFLILFLDKCDEELWFLGSREPNSFINNLANYHVIMMQFYRDWRWAWV